MRPPDALHRREGVVNPGSSRLDIVDGICPVDQDLDEHQASVMSTDSIARDNICCFTCGKLLEGSFPC